MGCGMSFGANMVQKSIPIPYVSIGDGTHSKCYRNVVPGPMLQIEERVLESLLEYFFAGFCLKSCEF